MKNAYLAIVWLLSTNVYAAFVPTELNAFGASMVVGSPTTFTNGQAYVNYLASNLSISTINNSAVGGHKYTEILGQINSFINNSGGVISPGALYVMGVTIDFQAPLEDQANAFASGLQALHDAGAQYILAPNAHNFSMLPVVPIENQSTVEIATQTFNGLYANAIAGLGISVMEVDFFGVYNTIAASPATYGIINLTDPCKDSGGSCAEPDSYFFWDTVHPTTVVHRELANELASIISPVPLPPTAPAPVPATAWLFVTVLIGLMGLMGSIGLRRKGRVIFDLTNGEI